MLNPFRTLNIRTTMLLFFIIPTTLLIIFIGMQINNANKKLVYSEVSRETVEFFTYRNG